MFKQTLSAAAAVLALAAMPAQADLTESERMRMTDAEFIALGEPAGPAPKMVDYPLGPSVLTHRTCSYHTGKPVNRTYSFGNPWQTGGQYAIAEADYHEAVASGAIQSDRWRWDQSHPRYGKGCKDDDKSAAR